MLLLQNTTWVLDSDIRAMVSSASRILRIPHTSLAVKVRRRHAGHGPLGRYTYTGFTRNRHGAAEKYRLVSGVMTLYVRPDWRPDDLWRLHGVIAHELSHHGDHLSRREGKEPRGRERRAYTLAAKVLRQVYGEVAAAWMEEKAAKRFAIESDVRKMRKRLRERPDEVLQQLISAPHR